MSDPVEQLNEAGVSADAIEEVLASVESVTEQMLDDYDITLSDSDSTIEVIQNQLLEQVIRLGTELDASTIAMEFAQVRDDFDDPESVSARSNIQLIVGMVGTQSNPPKGVYELGGALISANYPDQ